MVRLALRNLIIFSFLSILAFPLLGVGMESSVRSLSGKTDASSRWGSGWLDLDTPTDFRKGDVLRLSIGGTAQKVLVRLLPQGRPPGSSTGILGGTISVPQNRVVEVTISSDRKGIIQISVHGGSNPWGKFSLGWDNGSATIESAELIRK